MFINELREAGYKLLRWDIQDKAHWSSCSAEVLFGVAKAIVPGGNAIGYFVSPPPPNHDATFYKDWITKTTNAYIGANQDYRVRDGGLTEALPIFKEAAKKIATCSVLADLPTDEVVVRPLEEAAA